MADTSKTTKVRGKMAPAITSDTSASTSATAQAPESRLKASPPAKLTDIKDWNRWSKQFIIFVRSVGLQRYLTAQSSAPPTTNRAINLPGFEKLPPEAQQELIKVYAQLPSPV